MVAEKKEFKRYFPVINKCYCCCCCLELDSALKLCSIIFAVFSGLGVVYSQRSDGRIVFLINLVEFISLIFLAIGLFNKKVSYIRPYLYVCMISVVASFGFFFLFTVYFIFFRQYLVDSFLESAEDDPNLIYYYDNEEAASTLINTIYLFITVIIFIVNGIYIYFFLCVGSYMETIKEEQFRIEEARKLESDEANLNYTNQV